MKLMNTVSASAFITGLICLGGMVLFEDFTMQVISAVLAGVNATITVVISILKEKL